jgi:hypothetical protein
MCPSDMVWIHITPWYRVSIPGSRGGSWCARILPLGCIVGAASQALLPGVQAPSHPTSTSCLAGTVLGFIDRVLAVGLAQFVFIVCKAETPHGELMGDDAHISLPVTCILRWREGWSNGAAASLSVIWCASTDKQTTCLLARGVGRFKSISSTRRFGPGRHAGSLLQGLGRPDTTADCYYVLFCRLLLHDGCGTRARPRSFVSAVQGVTYAMPHDADSSLQPQTLAAHLAHSLRI